MPLGHTSQQSSTESEAQGVAEKPVQAGAGGTGDPKHPKTEPTSMPNVSKAAPLPTLSQQRRYHGGRDLSSSIASNLASARGIRSKYRSQPLTPSVSNDQAPGNLEVHPRKDGSRHQNLLDQTGKPTWVPPTHSASSPKADPGKLASRDIVKVDESTPGASEEGFSRFYNTFGSIINRLSAPLAFAGLPLIAEEPSPEPTAPAPAPESPSKRRSRVTSPQRASHEPDLSKIYSRAALRAISRDSHGPNDSFYVVPTSGHTVSYANILNWEQKEKRRLAASVHGDDGHGLEDIDEDDFVDARESQLPMSPGVRARLGKSRTERDVQNVVEELSMENASLKEVLDKLSKRLHAFELNSQTSHLALAQSLRLNRPGSPLSSSGGPVDGAADEVLRRRNKELEEQLATIMGRMDALEKEYSRSQLTLEKYRDKWEKLKAGAKARRDATHGDSGEPSRPSK